MKNRSLKHHLSELDHEHLEAPILVFHPVYQRVFKVQSIVPMSSITGRVTDTRPVIVLSRDEVLP